MKRTKTCAHCNHYNFSRSRCKPKDRPVCNVNTCDSWIPRMDLMKIKGIEFVEYDEYKIEEN